MRLFQKFRKARLIEGSYRWYIEYFQTNPATGKKERFRETYGLNRIKKRSKRRKAAQTYIKEINDRLPNGFPFEEIHTHLQLVNIVKALEKARDIKCSTDRIQTKRSYESYMKILLLWIKQEGLEELSIIEFKYNIARQFMDYIMLIRKVGPATYNNYISALKAMLQELVDREYLKINPFKGIQLKKARGKIRRAFNEYERQVVAEYIAEHDPMLTLGIALQYYCGIRPAEMRRMRIQNIDLNNSVINLNSSQTKNKENDLVTIPDNAVKFIKQAELNRYLPNYYIFGKGIAPHPDIYCGERSLNHRHRSHLLALQSKKLLHSIEGLSYYSWKDTGAQALAKKGIPTHKIMRHLRHKDLSYTQRYLDSLYMINYQIKELDNDLLNI